MTKIVQALTIVFGLILFLFPVCTLAQDYSCGEDSTFPDVEATNLLMVSDNGFCYLERDSHTPAKIASLTKIMTAICTFELLGQGYASQQDMLTVSKNAAEVGESTSNLKLNDQLSLHDAIVGMMVSSGNDASIVLAESLNSAAGKYLETEGADIESTSNVKAYYKDFVRLMNYMGKKLELEDSVFENPNGLDLDDFAGNLHSTASDVVKMARYIMQNPDFANIVKMPTEELNLVRDGKIFVDKLISTNILLTAYDGVYGIKTGYTEYAGNCFCGAVDLEGTHLYSVVLGSSTSEQKFRDTTSMYNWYYRHVHNIKLNDTNTKIDNKKVLTYLPHFEWKDKRYAAGITDDNKIIKVFEYKGDLYQEFVLYENVGKIVRGQLVGQVFYKQRDEVIDVEDLYALEDSEAPGTFEKIGIYLRQILLWIAGQTYCADVQTINKLELN
ncbi:MAG: D-alanyl-D-alanine carboxypeptidase [Eggerthellaceae bacterium]|nr:D-alanyl-D-alanine carboxypeptidase [Eggerthellaceae bacterium]